MRIQLGFRQPWADVLMARIRSVHPGFWTDEAYVSASIAARLFVIGLWNECDDRGVFLWKPVTLKMRVLPADNVDISALLAELVAVDVVRQFQVGANTYGVCRNFQQWQRPKKPNPIHPLPDNLRSYAEGSRYSSEPDDDEDGGSSPPPGAMNGLGSEPHTDTTVASSEPVGNQLPTSSRNFLQRKEGGGRKKEPPSLRSGPQTKKNDRGCRLPADWQPSQADLAECQSSGLDAASVAAKFRDYWHAKPGANGRKCDWPATWRNWCRREAEQIQARKPKRGQGSALGDVVRDWGLDLPTPTHEPPEKLL